MKDSFSSSHKVLIIGAGIGGLSTGIILAKLGFDVTVLEKNSQAGGLMRSYRRDGIECDVGVHYLGSLDRGQVLRTFFDYLEVTKDIPVSRMGEGGIIDRYVFDADSREPSTFDLPQGLDAYTENLIQAFPSEQQNIRKILGPIHEAEKQLHQLEFLYAGDHGFSLSDQFEPLGKILSELKCSSGLKSVLSIPSCWIGVPLHDCPAYYHNTALASYVSSSWRLKKSGADMANVFVDRLRALGGKVVTNAEIRQINVTSRVVQGVRLKSGEILKAPTVIGAVHPKVVLQMLSQGDVKPSYRKRISGLQDTHGIFSVHVKVAADAHPEIPYNLFKVDTDNQGKVPDLRYYQIRKTQKTGSNLLSILTSGKDELWAPWAKTSSGKRGKDYLALKEQHAAQLVLEAEQMFGPLSGAKVLDAYTPLTMRDWVNSPGGSAYGVLRSSSQMLATALLNRTAVKGLYLVGQSVTAPGIIGTIMGSFSTVKLMMGNDEFNKMIKF